MNLVCAICSDLFVPSDDVHITTCGHMFHYTCLLQWLERSTTCPQCRNHCPKTKLKKVYFNIAANLDTTEDNASLLQKLDDLTFKIREQQKSLKEFEQKVSDNHGSQKKMKRILQGLEEQLISKESAILAFRHENDMLKGDRRTKQKLEEELAVLRPQLESYATIKQALNSTVQEVEQMLASDTSRATVVAVAAALKRELQAQEIKKKEQFDRLHRLQNELINERKTRKALEENLSTCDSEIYRLEQLVKLSQKKPPCTSSPESGNELPELNTPDHQEARRKRPLNDLNISSPMSEKVRRIVSSSSPYLRVKTSSIGLAPLMRTGISKIPQDLPNSSASKISSSKNAIHPSSSSSEYSIFKNQRPSSSIALQSTKYKNTLTASYATERYESVSTEDTHKDALEPKPRFKLISSTVGARLKAGKLTRHPSTVVQINAIDQLREEIELE